MKLLLRPYGQGSKEEMEQATGVPVKTVHKALGLMAMRTETMMAPEALTADLDSGR